ncbi:MAG: hypothetical protein WCW67_02680 [Candidatus Margulisiibacteriota bacterium]|jgi:hypothetical protein
MSKTKAKLIFLFVAIMLFGYLSVAFASNTDIFEVEEEGRFGAIAGTNNYIGINLDWFEFKIRRAVGMAISYRKGDFPDDYILSTDLVFKQYNSELLINKHIIYEGIGLGYASVQNPNNGRSSGTYISNTKYDYIYISGLLGVVYWGDRFKYYLECQPVLSRDGAVFLFKIGAYL